MQKFRLVWIRRQRAHYDVSVHFADIRKNVQTDFYILYKSYTSTSRISRHPTDPYGTLFKIVVS
jgi:hypothetical protein